MGHCVSEVHVTGLTSNPAIFDQTIGNADLCDAAVARREGGQSFAKSWNDLMDRIASKSAALTQSQTEGATP
jgi:transaldolase